MELLQQALDVVLHLDDYLAVFVATYGAWIYVALFAVIFCETGLVVTPFLPGDSLLFVAGTIAATGGMNVHLLAFVLFIAAVLGDALNYHIGRWAGPKVFRGEAWWGARFFKPAHLAKTQSFYDKYGGKTIIIARFIPIVRTYAPFVAGLAKMPYPRFALYNITGGALWVLSLTYAGYLFGNIRWIKDNLTLVILAIIVVSILPAIVEVLRAKWSNRAVQQS
ncbi:MAG: DedA family protein [Proteobacteria bacterium]|nr:DedA family protein [Burkholderiales bacterium]